jgi:hypothetical protein
MSRPLRIELAGGLYHVTSRGDRREAIFGDDQDRTDWLAVLRDERLGPDHGTASVVSVSTALSSPMTGFHR